MKITQDAPRLPTLGLLSFLVLTVGCVIEPPTRPTGESTEIVLRIMGGIAGVEYTLRVDGTERILEGVSCASGCDFQPGETLPGLSPARIGELRDLALRAGLPTIGNHNYGTGCCDFFAYDLRFTEGDEQARVVGDATTFPQLITELADRVRGMASGNFPAIVDLGTERNDWPDDRLVVRFIEAAGGVLDVEVSYSGGCEAHEIDLVVFGGFMESFPVQVNAALAHEDRDDACDSIVQRTLRFDLTPLHDEYDSSYEPGGPLVMHVQDPGGGTPFSFELTWGGERD